MRMLARAEVMHGFRTTRVDMRTCHNNTADWITRELKGKVEAELQAKGWEKLAPPVAWGQLVSDAVELLMRLPGEWGGQGQQALIHHARRRPLGPLP